MNELNEIVAMSPNGQLVTLIPLYTRTSVKLDNIAGFKISCENDEPTGYLIDYGEENFQFFNSNILTMVEVLGEL